LSTDTPDYAERLRSKQTLWWKRLLHVQAPYHWNMRRQGLGRTLDVGCGIGRNLGVLSPGSVGVDHNAEAVALARSMGYDAYTVQEFMDGDRAVPASFDGLLLAHVIEHMDREQALKLLGDYLPFLRPGVDESFSYARRSAATPATRPTSGSPRTRTWPTWSRPLAWSWSAHSASRSLAGQAGCSSTTSSV
jgi:SAM-dependent methyltransferase